MPFSSEHNKSPNFRYFEGKMAILVTSSKIITCMLKLSTFFFISEYFSEANEYYGNNSIMAPQNQDSDVNHCEIIVVSRNLT